MLNGRFFYLYFFIYVLIYFCIRVRREDFYLFFDEGEVYRYIFLE